MFHTYLVNSGKSPPPPAPVAGSRGFYDASDSLTFDGVDRISAWADKGANLRNAAQATGANQPLRVANELNGNAIARFDGARFLVFGAGMLLDTSQAFTIDIIAKQSGGFFPGLLLLEGLATNFNIYDDSGGSFGTLRIVNPDWGLSYGAGAGLNAWYNLQITYNGLGLTNDANYSVRVTDVLQSITGSAETPPTNRNQISNNAGVGWNGDIAQIMLYDFVFSPTDRATQAAYRLSKWGF